MMKFYTIISVRNISNDKIFNNNEIRLFAIMRNESLRLPHFFEYYKSLGVDRFFLIDNSSTDDSVQIALQCQAVHVFRTTDSYVNHWYWMEHLLEKYGKGYWCVVVDIDELLYFPQAEKLSIPKFCQFLEETGSTAFRALLLDMYADKPVNSSNYTPGQNPLTVVSNFDKEYEKIQFSFFDRLRWQFFESIIFTGGMRDRVFGKSTPPSILSKIPLFKYLPDTYLVQGMHAINGAQISDLQGVVIHTKFIHDFIEEVREECVREQHYGNAFYYKHFNQRITQNPSLNLSFSGSVRFQDSAQLVELGLMKTSEQFEEFVRTQTEAENTPST
ncbi:glycosyltransferase family 2 protein [Rudanella lutea]|uniref:glycosyltransferase family 2 protein n=1 Tax=Rudanella lutea TaxID=451374 RepID=UPI001469D480|nr:glycosyltransferase family 2 protein [Rudanella lutea]